MKAIRELKKAGMEDEVKWGELGKRRVEMCLHVGECEKATRETSPLRCALPIGYLPLDHQILSLEHNLSGDYISALKNFTIWLENEYMSDLVKRINK